MRVNLELPAKKIRAKCICEWCRRAGVNTVVCFTCGNAAKALRDTGLDVVEISSHGELAPNKWMNTQDVRRAFPSFFDATSGHLPFDLMLRIADAQREYCGELNTETVYVVPSGSGETVCCLRIAYPQMKFVAEYDDNNAATKYDDANPLNTLTKLLDIKIERK